MKKAIQSALEKRGYETLTPVQNAVLDPDLDGRDLLVSAQTGSGKTLGFGLAIAPTLLQDDERFAEAGAPLALVIAPTRELALQVKRELSWLYAEAGAKMASCVGGMDMRDERRALARGAHVVVATPGRLRDHIMRGSIDLSEIRSVVLDEADEMLDLGFREDLEFILGEAPDSRQTLLFSATVPRAIAELAKSYQNDAVRVETKSETKQHADISYVAYRVTDRDAENAVINTLLYHQAPNAIVFGNTRAMVNRLTTRLSNRGFRAVALSGELTQSERTNALQAMRDGRAQVCIATDVAARGIDLPNLDLVIHAELPTNYETMLHRSGRTGRAGRKGVSALIVAPKNRKKAERILAMAKVQAEWGAAPSADAVNEREEARMLESKSWTEPTAPSEQETVEKLAGKFSVTELATAYLRLYRSVRSTPEELSEITDKPQAPRGDFGPSVWFSLAGGRSAGAEPRRLLPLVCNAADLTRDDIGAIRIQQSESFVQIKKSSADAFIKALGSNAMLEGEIAVKQLESAPSQDAGRPGPRAPYKGNGPKGQGGRPRSTPPVDYNDEAAPRQRKPKPEYRAKSGGHSGEDRKPGGVVAKKPRHKASGAPSTGKPSSKKNRARTAAAKSGGPKPYAGKSDGAKGERRS